MTLLVANHMVVGEESEPRSELVQDGIDILVNHLIAVCLITLVPGGGSGRLERGPRTFLHKQTMLEGRVSQVGVHQQPNHCKVDFCSII